MQSQSYFCDCVNLLLEPGQYIQHFFIPALADKQFGVCLVGPTHMEVKSSCFCRK